MQHFINTLSDKEHKTSNERIKESTDICH